MTTTQVTATEAPPEQRDMLEADGWRVGRDGLWRNDRFGGSYVLANALARLGSVFGELTSRPEPITIQAELQQAARELEAGSTRLAQTIKLAEGRMNADGEFEEGVSMRYQIAVEAEVIRLYDAAIADEKRPPAEDVRTAKAAAKVREDEPQLYAEHSHLQTEIKALRMWISARKEAISARQSILRGER